ncbi:MULTISPECIES: sulfatase-like hydrolase/transferase [Flavobacteriaceae]|uniref:sulfatase-like hydrolase/transferase n=1 Tax=Flavobacteriaceae TaxID=49546 RepID=UPI001492E870|nr:MULTISPECIES: sulfatase-like hydrolase/transferase [Allomuricauda]MDC6367632.1 sulfatase-like hydrolase/transferase [Muricauda sp. AC10]
MSKIVSHTIWSAIFCTFILWGCRQTPRTVSNNTKKRPNILMVIADDAGWNDVGYHGSEIQTPVIDALADNGLVLDRFYVAPTCSPTRAALLTGMPASRLGIVAPISGKSKMALPDSLITLPKALKELGYRTALFGKWHLGLTAENGPQAYGFDISYGFLHGQIDQYTHEYKNGDPSWHKNGKLLQEEGHVTDLLTKATLDYLEQPEETPFFITLAYSAPHFPLQEEKRWKALYRNIISDSSRVDFAAAMTHMDDALGKVMGKLQETGKDENTLVLFMSDNGGMENWFPKDQYGGRHGPNSVLGDNTPLKDYKTSNYEGGIRVPAIAYWKGRIVPNTSNSFISVIDIMPTLLDLVGKTPKPNTVKGNSFLSLFQGKDISKTNHIYIRGHLQENIIKPPFKLVRTRLENGTKLQLYHLKKDPEEKNDIWTSESLIGQELLRLLEQEFAKDAPTVNGPKIVIK